MRKKGGAFFKITNLAIRTLDKEKLWMKHK